MIRGLRDEGKWTRNEIADQANCTRNQVHALIRKENLSSMIFKPLNDEQKAKICDLKRTTQLTYKQIAGQVHCKVSQVNAFIIEGKLGRARSASLTQEKEKEVLRLRQSGKMTNQEIADKVGCTLRQVQNAIERSKKQQTASPSEQTTGKKRSREQAQEPTAKRHRSDLDAA